MISALENNLVFIGFVISTLHGFRSSWFVPFRLFSQVSDFHADGVDHTRKKRNISFKNLFMTPLKSQTPSLTMSVFCPLFSLNELISHSGSKTSVNIVWLFYLKATPVL